MARLTGIRTNGPSRLKLSYSQGLPSDMRGNFRELWDIYTPEADRRRGYASDLMRSVCAEADADGLILILFPGSPALADWYLTFGFDIVQETPLMMFRIIGADERMKIKPGALAAAYA